MTGKQTMTWNGEADSKLLLAILKVTDVKPDFEALTTDVVTCTPRAVQEHLKKLRKVVGPVDPNTQTPKKTATTPAKASRKDDATPTGTKKTRKPASSGKGQNGKAATNISDAEDTIGSDNEIITPAKKRKYQATFEASSDVGEETMA